MTVNRLDCLVIASQRNPDYHGDENVSICCASICDWTEKLAGIIFVMAARNHETDFKFIISIYTTERVNWVNGSPRQQAYWNCTNL